jgi:hypothetical protein
MRVLNRGLSREIVIDKLTFPIRSFITRLTCFSLSHSASVASRMHVWPSGKRESVVWLVVCRLHNFPTTSSRVLHRAIEGPLREAAQPRRKNSLRARRVSPLNFLFRGHISVKYEKVLSAVRKQLFDRDCHVLERFSQSWFNVIVWYINLTPRNF